MYKTIVCALQYYTLTKPEINFTINKIYQYLQQPSDTHWIAIKHLLRYLRHTYDHGFMLYFYNSLSITIYISANWASCHDDQRFTVIRLWHIISIYYIVDFRGENTII